MTKAFAKLPEFPALAITQRLHPAEVGQIDALDAVIILLPESQLGERFAGFPYAERLRKLLAAGADSLAPTRADLPNARGTTAIVASVKGAASTFELLTLARKAVTEARKAQPGRLGVLLPGHAAAHHARLAEAVVAAVAAANFEAPTYKAKPEKTPPIEQLTLFDGPRRLDFSRTLAAAEGNALARHLTLLPSNELTPSRYLAYAQKLARREGWRLEFLDHKKLTALKAGAFLAVSQGSDAADAGIVCLTYAPSKAAARRKPVALVGKGICFDTGGVNLKGAKGMYGMHGDMQGSAVALGTLLALTRLGVAFPVQAWLALSRNDIGPRAYTQNEVVRAHNGVSIEIVHTDAEGRMVLADTLAILAAQRPQFILDYATLTHSCITALGTRYSGAFCNQVALHAAVIAAGQQSGERVWPLPVDEDYDEELDSSIADIKQCTDDNEADAIYAARFLSRFVSPEVPWIHVDLAAAENEGGLGHIPTDITGFGVRFTLNLLLEQKVAAGSGK
jgi:leucyl aminopeptidase